MRCHRSIFSNKGVRYTEATMKRYLIALLVLCVVGVGLGTKGVSAVGDGEIYNLLSVVETRLSGYYQYLTSYHTEDTARFDSIDAKLERIYESCGRATTPVRRVSTAQISTCVNACFTSSLIGSSEQGAISPERFTSCISRCPSNTLRNMECAQAYTLRTATVVSQGSDYVQASQTADAYTRSCGQRVPADRAAICRVVADVHVSNLRACLYDQAAYTCQSDCMRNYRNDAGAIFCLLRCENRTRAAANYELLQQSGLLKADGSLSMDTLSNTVVDSIVASRAASPSPSVTPSTDLRTTTPSRETYAQCVYRCDGERTACIAAPPAGEDCERNYSTCYQSCNARLLNGGASR